MFFPLILKKKMFQDFHITFWNVSFTLPIVAVRHVLAPTGA